MAFQDNSFIGNVGSQVGYNQGYSPEDMPFFFSVMQNIPGASSTMGWNIRRTANTFTRGSNNFSRANSRFAFRGTRIREMEGGAIRRGVGETLRPSRFGRFSRAASIDPTYWNEVKGMNVYSPFNFLSEWGNKIGRRVLKNEKIANHAINQGIVPNSGDLFAPGFFGRIAANSRIARASDERFTKMAPAIFDSIRDINPEVAARYYGLGDAGEAMTAKFGVGGVMADKTTTHAALQASIGGQVSSALGSFLTTAGVVNKEGLTAGRAIIAKHLAVGAKMAAAGEDISGIGRVANWANRAVRLGEAAEAGSVGAKVGLKAAAWAGPAMEALGTVGTVMIVHDLASMAGKAVAAGAKTVAEAGRSIKGSIDKPTFGMGFKDNSVAATSRQRGVMAISNSRLNARSVLGSEASAMYAHFG